MAKPHKLHLVDKDETQDRLYSLNEIRKWCILGNYSTTIKQEDREIFCAAAHALDSLKRLIEKELRI